MTSRTFHSFTVGGSGALMIVGEVIERHGNGLVSIVDWNGRRYLVAEARCAKLNDIDARRWLLAKSGAFDDGDDGEREAQAVCA
ncbi:MAG: hypothetical protein AB7S36_23255 [Planctomycetota bacterium]